MSKIDQRLFTTHEHALEREYGVCPECGSELAVRHGKHGPFLGCQSYPTCEYHRPLVEKTEAEEEVLADTQCPDCGALLALKSGRYGYYIGCTNFPQCQYVAREPAEVSEETVSCPQCNQGELVSRTNRYGKRFYACSQYPQCKYLLNQRPVAQTCPDCGWGVLVEKKQRGKQVLQCPQRLCKYQSESI
ncbi:DNA topoisomerase family protein [Ferrimonas marina]|uniref:Putative DNA topoisomerase n=1 Tax=Ferrimonas marina TaxID=299255 RepID=A0A1M5ZH56_9GAMM|nr:topoisomerase DNA-binding C4 zinc finger domain-containing protein [Ferrimonas marina]SHI23587.1 putative DNA topoisomerase [Ferrimonas marina]